MIQPAEQAKEKIKGKNPEKLTIGDPLLVSRLMWGAVQCGWESGLFHGLYLETKESMYSITSDFLVVSLQSLLYPGLIDQLVAMFHPFMKAIN